MHCSMRVWLLKILLATPGALQAGAGRAASPEKVLLMLQYLVSHPRLLAWGSQLITIAACRAGRCGPQSLGSVMAC